MAPAFYNGYPLVNSDDGTYINSGFMLYRPDDRPLVYGLFLRVFSFNGASLWIAAFAQAFIVSWLVLKIIFKNVEQKKHIVALLMFVVLSFATSLSWITSEITPDVFTPVALMAMYLILVNEDSKLNTFLLYCIFLGASGTHLSHFVIFMLLIFGVFLLKKFFFPKTKRAFVNRALLILALLSILATVVNSSVYSKSKHVFFMASLLDKGLLIPYLDESCAEKNYAICKYKNEMSTDPNWFMWDNNSPLYKEGGWAATKKEYSEITGNILTSPDYIMLYIQASINATLKQFTDFKIGDGNFPFSEKTYVWEAIKNHVPNDKHIYETAWQHQESIVPKLELPNTIIYTTVFISALLLSIVLFRLKQIAPSLLFFIWLSVACIVVNVWDCATFAQVNGRYGCRVMWMLPFGALLTLFSVFEKGKLSRY